MIPVPADDLLAEGLLEQALRRSFYFSYGRAERFSAPSGASLPCS